MKKIMASFLPIFLILLGMGGGVAHGAEAPQIKAEALGYKLCITGTIPNASAGESVNILATKQGTVLEVLDQKDGDLTQDVVLIAATVVTPLKSFSLEGLLSPLMPEGEYDVFVKSASMAEPYQLSFHYENPAEILEGIKKLQEETNLEKIEQELLNLLERLKLDKDAYTASDFAPKRAYVLKLLESADFYDTAFKDEIAGFLSAYARGMLKGLIEGAGSDQELNQAIEAYRGYTNLDFSLYDRVASKGYLKELAGISGKKTYEDDGQMMTGLQTACFLTLFNKGGQSEMVSLFHLYNGSLFRIDEAVFGGLAKETVFKELSRLSPIASIPELDTAIQSVVKKLKTPAASPRPSGGSGSGSILAEPVKQPEDPSKESTPPPELFIDLGDVAWARDSINRLCESKVLTVPENKQFRPLDQVTREEFVKMVVVAFGIEPTQSFLDFSDVARDAWYAPYIAGGIQAGMIQGISTTLFGIGQPITREDATLILFRVLERGDSFQFTKKEKNFTDEECISNYAKEAVKKMASLGALSGYEDGSFRPNQNLTRSEAAVIIDKIINLYEKEIL